MENLVERSFWKGKRVLITGHTGFKGSWLSIWLRELGAEVLGVALKPEQELGNFRASRLESKIRTVYQDIRFFEDVLGLFREFRPEIVFHLAAQSLVGRSYKEPRLTFETNALGTLNILESIRQTPSVQSAVLITSDKCYQNVEQIWGYRENDRLGGEDPYSASKGCAELAIHSYQRCYFNDVRPITASCRAGNVIGGGDWSEHRIVPDCFRSLFDGRPILLRNPGATRPWQFVLEPLRGYLMLAEKLFEGRGGFCGSWNFGPPLEQTRTVRDVARTILETWGSGALSAGENASFHESQLLQLDCTKARMRLGWQPLLSFEESVKRAAAWYKRLHGDPQKDMYDFCASQIAQYAGGLVE